MGLRLGKIVARIGVAFLIFVALSLIVRTVLNYTTGRKLENYLEEMRAAGKPLDRQAALRPCADRDNGALLWKAAEALLLIEDDDRAVLADFSKIQAWADVSEANKRGFADIVAKNRRAIDLVREAASKTCFRYGDASRSGGEIELPNSVKMIQAMRLLALDALLEAEAGRVEEAVDRILAGLAFQRLFLDDPSLIGYLVSIANAKALLVNLNRILSGKEPPSEVLAEVIAALDSEAWRTEMARVFEFENARSILAASRHILKGWPLSDLHSRWSDRAFNWVFRPVLKTEIVWVSRRWDDMRRAALLPFYETEQSRLLNTGYVEHPPRLYRMAGLLMPHLATVMLKEASLEATIEATRIGLAGKIHRRRTGRFPEKIGDLVPGLLDKEPVDPFTGEPFVYRVSDNGFIVYSLGSNKKDDGGKSSPITHMVMEKDDDWAWRENWDR